MENKYVEALRTLGFEVAELEGGAVTVRRMCLGMPVSISCLNPMQVISLLYQAGETQGYYNAQKDYESGLKDGRGHRKRTR